MLTAKAQNSLAFHSLNHIFPRAGAFRSFGRQKNMKERVEENPSERLKLMNAVEYNSKQKRVHSKFLLNLANPL